MRGTFLIKLYLLLFCVGNPFTVNSFAMNKYERKGDVLFRNNTVYQLYHQAYCT